MSYKINPLASTTDPGNMSSTDKTKINNYPNFDSTDTAFSFSPAKTVTIKQQATESCVLNANGPAAWSFNANNHIKQANNTASSTVLINLPILKKYIGATFVSIRIYYIISGTTRAPQTYPSANIRERELTSITDNNISTSSNFSEGYSSVGTMNSILITTSSTPSQPVIDDNKIYYLQIIGESGTNSAAAPNNLISHIEINLSNVTKFYQLK